MLPVPAVGGDVFVKSLMMDSEELDFLTYHRAPLCKNHREKKPPDNRGG